MAGRAVRKVLRPFSLIDLKSLTQQITSVVLLAFKTASLHWFHLSNCRNKPNTLTPLLERGSRIEEEKEELICIEASINFNSTRSC